MEPQKLSSSHILTFDIEDWFHLLDHNSTRSQTQWEAFEPRIEKNLNRILDFCTAHKLKATFFCLGWVAEKYPDLIRKIDTSGFEIGSHSYYHQLAYELTPDDFRKDLNDSLSRIEQCIGKKVTLFRVPGFSFTEKNRWVFEILIESGITIDSSIFPAGRGHGGFPSFGVAKPTLIQTPSGSLKEFPINTYPILGKPLIFSGGGYFRLLPYSFIRTFMNSSPYVMTYFHPRDFDHEQPLLKDLPLSRKFKSYYGLRGAWNKFERLTREFNFVDLHMAQSSTDWTSVPVVSIS